jgi:hypothetical protein
MGAGDQPALLRQVQRNTYRVLGLPADASKRDILVRAAALDRTAKVGIIHRPSAWNFGWYGPSRQDRSTISDAAGRLSNSRQRLTERLFWIAQTERLVASISPETLDQTIITLQASL